MYIVIRNTDNRIIWSGTAAPVAVSGGTVAEIDAERLPETDGYLTYEDGAVVAHDRIEPREERYARLVSAYVRQRYSQAAVEAILNNYLADPASTVARQEFEALQVYRAECKARAAAELAEVTEE